MRVDHVCDPAKVWTVLMDCWQLPVPRLLISVTGGAKRFYLRPRLKNILKQGLVSAAVSTGKDAACYFVSWCFKPSQPQGITSGLRGCGSHNSEPGAAKHTGKKPFIQPSSKRAHLWLYETTAHASSWWNVQASKLPTSLLASWPCNQLGNQQISLLTNWET